MRVALRIGWLVFLGRPRVETPLSHLHAAERHAPEVREAVGVSAMTLGHAPARR